MAIWKTSSGGNLLLNGTIGRLDSSSASFGKCLSSFLSPGISNCCGICCTDTLVGGNGMSGSLGLESWNGHGPELESDDALNLLGVALNSSGLWVKHSRFNRAFC